MRTDDQIRHLVRSGAATNAEAGTELLLDIRRFVERCATALEQIQINTRKPGRARKPRAKSSR